MTYSEAELGVIVAKPTVIGPGASELGVTSKLPFTVDVELPTMSKVSEPDVCRATTVVEAPLPTVTDPPGDKVSEPIM